jgi:hypothetical protein
MIPLFLIGKSDQPFSVPITYRTVEYLIVANNSSQTHSYNEHMKNINVLIWLNRESNPIIFIWKNYLISCSLIVPMNFLIAKSSF